MYLVPRKCLVLVFVTKLWRNFLVVTELVLLRKHLKTVG